MHVTVAICTWNRGSLLARTLKQMTELLVPEHTTWELLVVDNNSTDQTAAVIASFEGTLPIRGLFERVPGKSHALNLATREARGEYILWTDDDVLVEPTWLAAYTEVFMRRPAAGVFGGLIRPWFLQDPPAWLRLGFHHVSVAYAALDYGPEEIPLTGERVPFGANMAVRTATQRAFPYDTALGPRPGGALRGEETDVARQMIAHGVEGWWVPGAVVRHYIPPERQSVAYLRDYYMGLGQLLAIAGRSETGPRMFGKPRWLWRAVIENEARYRVGRLVRHPEQWVLSLREASIAWGRFWNS